MAPPPALPDDEARRMGGNGLATKADLADLKDGVAALRHSVDALRQELKEDARGAWKQFFAVSVSLAALIGAIAAAVRLLG